MMVVPDIEDSFVPMQEEFLWILKNQGTKQRAVPPHLT
jgi:hypothetical protein